MNKAKSFLAKKSWIIVVLVSMVFVALSAFSAYKFSPWHDESYSAILIDRTYADIVSATANDVHPPLYYVLLKTWAGLAGYSMPALRLFSTFLMLSAVLIIWRVMIDKRFVERRHYLVLVAMLFGAFALRFSFEARMYALGAFVIALAFWLQMKLMSHKKISWLLSVGLGVVFALAIYTHYFLLFFVMATAFYTAWTVGFKNILKKSFHSKSSSIQVKNMAISYITSALLFLPWLSTAFGQYKEVTGGGFWIGPFTVTTIPSMILNSFAYVHSWMVHGWEAVGGLTLIITIILVLVMGYKQIVANNAGKYALSVVIIPLIVLIAISLPPFTPAFQDRYLSFYGAFLYAMVTVVLLKKWSHNRSWKLATIATVIAFFAGVYNVVSMGNSQGYTPYPHFVSNQIRDDVLSVASENRKVVLVANDLWYFFDIHVGLRDTVVPTYMYLDKNQSVYRYGNWSAVYGRDELLLREASSLPADAEIWFVHSHEAMDNKNNPFASLEPKSEKQYGYAKVTIY